ncbi:MAG: hypothetical protein ACLFQB_03275 [Chitinispirillaceae bacterium]
MKKSQHFLLTILSIAAYSAADTTIVSESMYISAYLPDNWTATELSDSSITLQDTTDTCQSIITVRKYTRDDVDFPSPEDWTRAHFIAYMLVVENSYDPFCSVLYFDSTSSTQGSLWAPEAFCEFYAIDTTLGAWDEFMRYTASGDYGYEIYAIGDTADMKENFGLYSTIIQKIEIETPVSSIENARIHNAAPKSFLREKKLPSGFYDLRGKRHHPSAERPSGVFYRPSETSIKTNVK